jgi:hypothetical protein
LLSAAIADRRDAWLADVLPKDRATILGSLANAEAASKDDATRNNLAALGAAPAAAK